MRTIKITKQTEEYIDSIQERHTVSEELQIELILKYLFNRWDKAPITYPVTYATPVRKVKVSESLYQELHQYATRDGVTITQLIDLMIDREKYGR